VSGILDHAVEALNGITEAAVSDQIEVALRGLVQSLSVLSTELPETAEGCITMLEALGASHNAVADHLRREAEVLRAQGQRLGAAEQGVGPSFSQVEFQEFMQMIKALLSDVRSALTDISREEIEELADVGLMVTRMALKVAQSAALQLQHAINRESRQTVIIEDLEEPIDPASSSRATPCHGGKTSDDAGKMRKNTHLVLRPSHRYLWRPLWPRLRAWAARPMAPLQRPAAAALVRVRQRPLETFVVASVAMPAVVSGAFAAFWASVLGLPWVLLGDAALQHLYASRKQRVDDVVEGSLQVTRLAYLSSRLAGRRLVRLAHAQARRWLNGRTAKEAAMETIRDPVGSASAVLHFAARAAEDTFGAARAAYRMAPELGLQIQSYWHKFGGGGEFVPDTAQNAAT